MKKVVMVMILGQGKIKKQQRRKEIEGEGDLSRKMEPKEKFEDTVEDLLKAWSLIKDA